MTTFMFECVLLLWLDMLPERRRATFGMRVGFTSDVRPAYVVEVEPEASGATGTPFTVASLRVPMFPFGVS